MIFLTLFTILTVCMTVVIVAALEFSKYLLDREDDKAPEPEKRSTLSNVWKRFT